MPAADTVTASAIRRTTAEGRPRVVVAETTFGVRCGVRCGPDGVGGSEAFLNACHGLDRGAITQTVQEAVSVRPARPGIRSSS